MGHGSQDHNVDEARTRARRAAGYTTNFAHTEDIRAGRKAAGCSDKVDPNFKLKNGDNAGTNMREALDSEEHPNSVPIAVFFDVTGSMNRIPVQLQEKLKLLWDLTLKYIEHPQLLFGAIGDAYSDRCPLQVGQFESDNRANEQLEELYLEGNGGGQGMETYELAMLFMAQKAYLDSLKRNKKGYLFTMGDEKPYPKVPNEFGWSGHTLSSLGIDPIEGEMLTPEVVRQVQQKFEYFHFIIPSRDHGGMYSTSHSLNTWRALLNERVLVLDNPANVAEAIATVIGMMEGRDHDSIVADIKEVSGEIAATSSSNLLTR